MKIWLAIILILIFGFNCFSAQQPKFTFTAPKDWKQETIQFPLDFAPDIDYQGFEELRFAPGMFNRSADTYFSYTFFWWLKGRPPITAANLADTLTKYFRGLCKEVAKGRGLNIDLNTINAQVQAQPERA